MRVATPMNKRILLRFFAFVIDWLIIMAYAGILFSIIMLVSSSFQISFSDVSPQIGQLLGLFTLTIPVILYFIITESGSRHASFGKQIMNLRVYDKELREPSTVSIVVRTLVLFAPWELAHFGVHWIVFYSRHNMYPPVWVLVAVIVPQIIMGIYILILITNKDNQTLYELISKTRTDYNGKK